LNKNSYERSFRSGTTRSKIKWTFFLLIVVAVLYIGGFSASLLSLFLPERYRYRKVSLTISEEVKELSEKQKELEQAIERLNYHQKLFFPKALEPVPEVSKVAEKQETILAERGAIIMGFDNSHEVRIFRLKDKDRLPVEFESEIPEKIEIDGDSVIYVFRIRAWIHRIR
jgi:hypothetical protein